MVQVKRLTGTVLFPAIELDFFTSQSLFGVSKVECTVFFPHAVYKED